ncbi:hypothetical protein NDU88_008358 [Pleurodeles waltl]|uniref:Uncharacterized protein n=1 Tax=Pleurodeles waltl TaxID=8319 RepID=A0AAV7PRX2_PLEWA|nr:hypothetical protein NDU88_008358 [Pleurodeles waltl]
MRLVVVALATTEKPLPGKTCLQAMRLVLVREASGQTKDLPPVNEAGLGCSGNHKNARRVEETPCAKDSQCGWSWLFRQPQERLPGGRDAMSHGRRSDHSRNQMGQRRTTTSHSHCINAGHRTPSNTRTEGKKGAEQGRSTGNRIPPSSPIC